MKKLLAFLSIVTLFTFLSCNNKNTKKSKNIDFVNHYLSDKDLDALEYPEIKTENFETIKHSYILNNKSVKSPLRYDIPYQSRFLTFETDENSKLYFHFYLDQKEDFAGEEKTKFPVTTMDSRPGLPLSSPSSVEYKFRLKTTNMETLNIQLMTFNPIFPKQSIPTASVEISQGKVFAISREYNFSVPVEEYRSSDNGPRKKDLLGFYNEGEEGYLKISHKDRIITVTYNDKSVEIPLVAPLKDETTWMYNFGLAPKKAGEEFIEMIVSDLKLEY